jgi:type I restriction enzyme S subunit
MARKMKDSGIEWIGEIPEGWEIVPVRSCFDEVRTKNTDGQEQNALQFKSGNIISKTNFNASMDDYVADTITNYTVVLPDTVMINGLNLNYDFKSLRVALVKEKGVITSAYLAIFPDRKKISPQYATYLFKGYETKMAFHNMGAGIRKTLGYKEFKNQPLLLPSEKEQNKISAYLDSKCSHIDIMLSKIRSSIEEYKKLKQAIITQAVTKGVRGKREMKDSGVEWIGEIPKEWDILNLVAHTSMLTPMRDRPENLDGPIPWIRIEDFDGKYISSSKASLGVSKETVQSMNLKIYPVGTILCTSSCIMGKCAIVSRELVSNQRFIGIIPDQNTCENFLYYLMLSNSERMNYLATGALQANLSRSSFEHLKVQFPSYQEQKEIADYLDAKCAEIDGLIAKKEQLVKELESYKKSLIYEVVTGKREV